MTYLKQKKFLRIGRNVWEVSQTEYWEKQDNHLKETSEDKIKRLQSRWNRFDDEEERYKAVKPKDGGGCRYNEVNPSVQVI